MNSSPTPAQLIALGSAAVLFLGSLLAWISVPGVNINTWGSTFGVSMFPVYTLPGLLGLAVGASLVARVFAGADLPSAVLTFSLPQLGMVAGLWAFLPAFSFVVSNDEGTGIGAWLSVLAAIGLFVGSFMEHKEGGATSTGPAAPPQPF